MAPVGFHIVKGRRFLSPPECGNLAASTSIFRNSARVRSHAAEGPIGATADNI